MQILQGIAVSPGVAVGEALVLDNEGFRIPRRFVARDVVQAELIRLNKAFTQVAVEIEESRQAVAEQLGDKYSAIFAAHLQMLDDPQLRDNIEKLICERHYSPEYAVSRVLRRYAKVFQSLENGFVAEPAHDIFDIEKRLLRNLLGHRREELSLITSPVVVLAHNLTPSETANLNREFVLGFVSETGGPGGHTAIVAEAMEIPAVVGTGSFLTDVSGGDVLIVDGDLGRVVLQPDEETLAKYRHEAEQHKVLATQLEELSHLSATTIDGTEIHILANIEFPREVSTCLSRGADGVGLYRTEFLYLSSESEPTEKDQFAAYSQVIQAMGDRPVVMRTLDLGADKLGTIPKGDDDERNPFLGLRSIRLALRHIPMFRTQLRAILRASVLGDLRVMFPLISNLQELRQAKSVLHDVMEDLDDEGIEFNSSIPVGMMVEVPSAVMMLDHFVKEINFVSIGTNDLIQYTLAVDRGNKDVASLYNPCDPSVLRLIQMSVDVARDNDVPVSLCGQMSANSLFTPLLLGLGLRDLSVTPSSVPEIKQLCRSVSIDYCQSVAKRAREMDDAMVITAYLKDEIRKIAPELPVH